MSARCDLTDLLVNECACPVHAADSARRATASNTATIALYRSPTEYLSMWHRTECTHVNRDATDHDAVSFHTVAEAQQLIDRLDHAVCLTCEPPVYEQAGRRSRHG